MPRKYGYLDSKKKKKGRLDSAFDKDATTYPSERKKKKQPPKQKQKRKTSRINKFLNDLYGKD